MFLPFSVRLTGCAPEAPADRSRWEGLSEEADGASLLPCAEAALSEVPDARRAR